MKLLLIVLLLLSSTAQAYELRLLTFEAAKIYNKRDPQFPAYDTLKMKGLGTEQKWNHHISLNLDMDLISTPVGAFYWDQEVVGRSTVSQYREVWWDFEFGINIHTFQSGSITLFHHHKSEHALDLEDPKYPLEDYYGLRLCFLGTGCRR